MKKALWIFMIVMMVICGLLSVLYMVGVMVAKRFALDRLSPEMQAEYPVFKNKRWAFAEEDLYPPPFDSETIDAAKRFEAVASSPTTAARFEAYMQDYNAYYANQRNPEVITTVTLESLLTGSEGFDPLFLAWEDMARRPDYAMSSLVLTKPLSEQDIMAVPNYLRMQQITRLHAKRMDYLIKQGRSGEALRLAENIALGSRSHSHDFLISQLIMIAMRGIVWEQWYRAVDAAEDVGALKNTLAVQKSVLLSEDYVTTGVELTARDQYGIARAASRGGLRLDVADMRLFDMLVSLGEYNERYQREVLLPRASGDEKRRIMSRLSASGKSGHNLQMFGVPQNRFLRKMGEPLFLPMVYAMMMPNWSEASTRVKVSMAHERLLLQHTAARLYELEKGSAPGAVSDLVPEYLDAIPVDPFRKGEKPLSEDGGLYYSYGPDEDDNKMAVPYDPTNGSRSDGDIYFHLSDQLDSQ